MWEESLGIGAPIRIRSFEPNVNKSKIVHRLAVSKGALKPMLQDKTPLWHNDLHQVAGAGFEPTTSRL